MDVINTPKFASRVQELLEEHHVPGVAIALYQNGSFASAGFGQASLNPSVPCTPETLFDIASASKSITAASVALLVEDDKEYPEVKWDSIMSHLLPGDFVMHTDQYTQSVTLDDIVGHRSGFPRHDLSYFSPKADHPDDARSITRNLRNLPTAAPIRTKFIYCNIMYTVQTYLVEQKTGLSFSDFVQQNFFGPLKMTSTNIQPSQAREKGLGSRIATGHQWINESETYKSFPFTDDPAGIGAGSIVTSVNDYIKYVVAFMNHERPFSNSVYKGLIRPRIIQEPDAKKLPPNTSMSGYAAGWQTYWYRGRRIVMHDGNIQGSGTIHFFVPDVNFAGVIFGNSSDADTVTMVLAEELIDEALGVPVAERPDWNSFETHLHDDEDEKDETGKKKDPAESLRQQICPGIAEYQPQTTPLSAYAGKYWNAGYRAMEVQIKDGKLFVDARERSFGFCLIFDHVCEQAKYVARVVDVVDGDDDDEEPMEAQFEFKDGKVLRMGLQLEEELEDRELVWFNRV